MSSNSPQRPIARNRSSDGLQADSTRQQDPVMSSTPVEMSNLDAARSTLPNPNDTSIPSSNLEHNGPIGEYGHEETQNLVSSGPQDLQPQAPLARVSTSKSRSASQQAPTGGDAALHSPALDLTLSNVGGPGSTIMITLLLTSGARHPYRIDDKYLKKRNITAPNNDPFEISIYTLKELIWREWREGETSAKTTWAWTATAA